MPHLMSALPGSNVLLRITFALGGILFSPVSWPFRLALYNLLGSIASGPKFLLRKF
jgi:hypothetical protein